MRTAGRQSKPPDTAYRLRFGKNVKKIREDTGTSQENLAHQIGMSRRYLSGIERGEANPTLDQLVRLATGLGVGVTELFP